MISSAGENLGCFLTREAAEAASETGQERLLSVIGETARLEQREVLEIIDPDEPRVRLDAGHLRHAGGPARRRTVRSRRSRTKEVVYLGQSNDRPPP